MKKLMFVILVFFWSGFCFPKEYFVAPDGDDKNPGTLDRPFRTLEQARLHVRDQIEKGLKEDIEVIFRGGRYPFTKTVVFDLKDSPVSGHNVVYKAYPDEIPVFSSGASITEWKKLQNIPTALPEVARGKVWVTDISQRKEGKWQFYTLYDEKGLLSRARSKGFQPTTIIGQPPHAYRYQDRDVLHFPAGELKEWENLEDIEIFIRPTHDWVVNYLQLKSVDEASLTARTVQKGTYTLAQIHNLPDEPSCWVENVLEALDEPGEWVLNSREARLYLWPRNNEKPQDILAPTLRELIRVEGEINQSGPVDKPVKNLVFSGLTFSHSDRYVNMIPGNTMLVFRGVENCVIKNCIFQNSGCSAISLELYCQNNRICGNHIHHIGGGAISLRGYGPGTKDVNKRNQIVNNHIHHCGMLYWNNGGISIWQSGENVVRNNRIHDLNYGAIWVRGIGPRYFGINDPTKWKGYHIPSDIIKGIGIRWEEVGEVKTKWDVQPFLHSRFNIVEDNEIHDIMKILGDGNGISISGSGPGNIIRRNLIYNANGWWSIRTDDDQFNTIMRDNIIIGNGFKLKHKNNFIQNNILIYGGKNSTVLLTNSPDCRVYRNIFIDSFHRTSKVFYSDTYDEPDSRVYVDYNLYWGTNQDELEKFLKEMRAQGYDKHSRVTDPLFINFEQADFRLKRNSPALQLGFQPIDYQRIGLLDEPAFERLKKEGFKVKVPEIQRGSFPGN